MNAQTGIINIRGKEYQTVALRVQLFRQDHPDWTLETSVIDRDEKCVVMRAAIPDKDGRTLATGFAEEYRSASQINKTSALENAETSAIGRALAALGYGGTEYATANEVQNAIHQQGAVRDNANRTVSPDRLPPADFAKFENLRKATDTNLPRLMAAIGLPETTKPDELVPADFAKAIGAMEGKLAKMAKAETNKVAANA